MFELVLFRISNRIISDCLFGNIVVCYPLISNIKGFVSQYLFAVFVFLLCSVFKVLVQGFALQVISNR